MKNKSVDPITLKHSQEGLIQLAELLGELANKPNEVKPNVDDIPQGGIHGSKINGGTITNFSSVGIKDNATKLTVLVDNNGITTDKIDVDYIEGDTSVNGSLTIDGDITVRKIYADEIAGDLRNSSSKSLEFSASDGSVYNKGLLWQGKGVVTKQLVLKNNPDRLWSSVSFDISKDSAYHIGGEAVLSATGLGNSVRDSKLRSVGTLDGLDVAGHVAFGDGFRYNVETDRLGLGTEQPNGNLAIQGWASEFIIDVDDTDISVGAFSNSGLHLITDNTPRISIAKTGKIEFGIRGSNSADVNIHGKLGVGVTTVDDVSIESNGPVRFEGKKFAVAGNVPEAGSWNKGDIVWNSDPRPTSYVGWICVKSGTPGDWKTFGAISV
jgi:hypothetical protein